MSVIISARCLIVVIRVEHASSMDMRNQFRTLSCSDQDDSVVES